MKLPIKVPDALDMKMYLYHSLKLSSSKRKTTIAVVGKCLSFNL